MNLSPRLRRLVHDGATLAGLLVIGFVWWLVSFNDYQYDAMAYWSAGLEDPYRDSVVGRRSEYLYSPAFAQVTWPLTLLPWEGFRALWAAANLGALVWLAGPILGALLVVVPGSPVIDEVSTGNIHLLLALAMVLAVRWPAAWAFPLLTKVTPGVAIGYLVGARRWRRLLVALGVTAGIALVSFATVPGLWFQWVDVLFTSSGVEVPGEIGVIPGPLAVRTVAAGAIAAAGGWFGWRWTMPVAATVALPVPWSSGLAVLVAIIGLWRRGLLVERLGQGASQANSTTAWKPPASRPAEKWLPWREQGHQHDETSRTETESR